MKIYNFKCDYDSPMDECNIVAENQENAISVLKQTIDFHNDDWVITEIVIEEGLIL